jgi:hypothetical protein
VAGDVRRLELDKKSKKGELGVKCTRPSSCPAPQLQETTRSNQQVISSRLDVKGWNETNPTADDVRPGRCPRCGAASRPAGGGIVLHGHGIRERQCWGPPRPDAKPELRETYVRRYKCRRCCGTATVAPRETLRKRLYSAAAIGLALALFGLVGLSLAQVRRRVSPFESVGATSAATWRTVPRWTQAVREGRLFDVRKPPDAWTPRRVAERAAATLAARGPAPTGPPDWASAAFYGALAG